LKIENCELKIGKILVFVNPHWALGSLADDGNLMTNDLMTNDEMTNDEMTNDETTNDETTSNQKLTILDQFTLAIKKALEKLGLFIENGIAKVKELIAEKITAKKARLDRIEMIDQATGEIYCTWIENGEWKKVKGECGSLTLQPTTNDLTTNNQQATNNETTNNGTMNNQATSSGESTCTSSWQCQKWQPSADSVCSGETFAQNCSQWVDLNNCGINEIPTTTQQAIGTKDCSTSTLSTPSTSTLAE